MKARVKATEEIVEVKIDYRQDADYISTSGQLYWQRELDFNVDYIPDYWEKLKHQYAGMAMQGIMSNPNIMETLGCKNDHERLVITIISIATTLVEKLKEESKC